MSLPASASASSALSAYFFFLLLLCCICFNNYILGADFTISSDIRYNAMLYSTRYDVFYEIREDERMHGDAMQMLSSNSIFEEKSE